MKKATEIHSEIKIIDMQLNDISEALVRPIDWDGIDPVYLKSKFQAILNTANHIKGQFKHLRIV